MTITRAGRAMRRLGIACTSFVRAPLPYAASTAPPVGMLDPDDADAALRRTNSSVSPRRPTAPSAASAVTREVSRGVVAAPALLLVDQGEVRLRLDLPIPADQSDDEGNFHKSEQANENLEVRCGRPFDNLPHRHNAKLASLELDDRHLHRKRVELAGGLSLGRRTIE